jgi:hypothetical protein
MWPPSRGGFLEEWGALVLIAVLTVALLAFMYWTGAPMPHSPFLRH